MITYRNRLDFCNLICNHWVFVWFFFVHAYNRVHCTYMLLARPEVISKVMKRINSNLIFFWSWVCISKIWNSIVLEVNSQQTFKMLEPLPVAQEVTSEEMWELISQRESRMPEQQDANQAPSISWQDYFQNLEWGLPENEKLILC